MAACGGHAIVEFAQGESLAPRHGQQQRGAALESLGLGQVGDRPIERIDRHVRAQPFRQDREGLRGADVAVEFGEDRLRFRFGPSHHGKDTRHDQGAVRRPAILNQLRLQAVIKGPRFIEVVLRGEDHVGDARRQGLPRARRSRLDQHRMALRRARHIQPAVDGEILAVEIGDPQAARPHEGASLLVGDEGAIVPAVPEQPAGLDEFLGHGVALGMRWMLAPEHGARLGIGCRHHVPAGASARQMIQRGEAAGQLIGLGIGRRSRGGQPQASRGHRQSRKQRQRFELADGRGVFVIAGGETIAQKEHVELAALGGGGDVFHQREVGTA